VWVHFQFNSFPDEPIHVTQHTEHGESLKSRTQNLLQLNEKFHYRKKYHIIGHQKCVLCTGTEHFPDGTHKAVITDHKRHLRTQLAVIQSFKYTNICILHKLKVIH
jgi:hypothetical protein